MGQKSLLKLLWVITKLDRHRHSQEYLSLAALNGLYKYIHFFQ